MASYIVAITGASGVRYATTLLTALLQKGHDVELVVSDAGLLLMKEEAGLVLGGRDAAKKLKDHLWSLTSAKGGKKSALKGNLRLYSNGDIAAGFASGSALKKTMIICPCSMGTLGRIASGVSGNLIERAADCILKERGRLVLVPRETPFNAIHLENMLRLTHAGAIILPAMPAFYNKPTSIDDMINFMVGKILDAIGIENDLYRRWGK